MRAVTVTTMFCDPLWGHGLSRNEWTLLTPEGSQNIEMTDTPRCSTRRQAGRKIEDAIALGGVRELDARVHVKLLNLSTNLLQLAPCATTFTFPNPLAPWNS